MKKLIFIVLLLAGLGAMAQQSRTISGRVYDDTQSPLPGVTVIVTGTKIGAVTNAAGHYAVTMPEQAKELRFAFVGFVTQVVKITDTTTRIDVYMKADARTLNEVVVASGYGRRKGILSKVFNGRGIVSAPMRAPAAKSYNYSSPQIMSAPPEESYKGAADNSFADPKSNPLSTFSVDVDAASYSNFRRFINNGELPPADAVRIEEMINYFHYDLPAPTNGEPVAIHTELSFAPWNPQHRLLRIGLKAKPMNTDNLPASNLVFLVDVSGSMDAPNKLPLVKAAMRLLVDQLRAQDKVAIVVYAGQAGLVLPATPGNQKTKILDAIEGMNAGGSTAGGEGIKLAYKIARENLVSGGNNRIILSTDGDFNVGASSDEDMEHLIERERQSGVHLSVLGFGMGNYKDSKMETIADKGNGNYAYIDNLQEAKKKLVNEFAGTLFMVAKDVKLQVEFNPAKVAAYRLLGYEDRLLNKEDFNNDAKDAGDMGAGHTVTAFYEIIPAGVKDQFSLAVDPLKYQKEAPLQGNNAVTNELLTVKFRYKQPEGSGSKLSQAIVYNNARSLSNASADFRFAAAVAEVGMLLRQSPYKQQATFDQAISLAKTAKGNDEDGYRSEFIRLAESAKLLGKSGLAANE